MDRTYERSMSTSSVSSSLATGLAPSPELDKLELGERGLLHPVYCQSIERWFLLGQQNNVPSVRLQKASLLAPLTVPLLLKAFAHICSSLAPEMSIKIFASVDSEPSYTPCVTSSLCPKQANPERSILDTRYILLGRQLNQWKESLSGEINLQEHNQVALKMQRTHQRFVSFVQDASAISCPEAGKLTTTESDRATSLLVPRQRFLWVTIKDDQQFTMWLYNFNKDSLESLSKQCCALIQWHNARWALLNSIVAQKLGLFHNHQCSPSRTHPHHTLRNNPFLNPAEMDTLVKMYVPPPSRDYNSSANSRKSQVSLPHNAHLEAFRDSKPARLLSQSPYGQQGDLVVRHGQQWIEKRYAERREEMQRLQVLWSRSSGNTISVTEDVMHLFKQVARIIHFCFTPLLFLPKWRLQVARTRDPNLATMPNSSIPHDGAR